MCVLSISTTVILIEFWKDDGEIRVEDERGCSSPSLEKLLTWLGVVLSI